MSQMWKNPDLLPADDRSVPWEKRRQTPFNRPTESRSATQMGRDEFRDKHSNIEYWRNRPLVELQIEIRRLEQEQNPESSQRASRLKHIMSQLQSQSSASTSRQQSRQGQTSGQTWGPGGNRGTLPPSEMGGRITRGNFPRRPSVSDMHPSYSQMSPNTRQLLRQRHTAAQNLSWSEPPIGRTGVDAHMDRMRNYDIGLRRQPYTSQMRTGEGVDVAQLRREVPQTLSRTFGQLRQSHDRARQRDSTFTKLASLEVWNQRRLDDKYHPKRREQQPRQHTFGRQQPQQYRQDWNTEAMRTKPFSPVWDHYSNDPIRRSSMAPQSRRPPYDSERPPLPQRVAQRYHDEARARYTPLPRDQRRNLRAAPFRADEQNLGIDMSENTQEWESQHRVANNPLSATLGDHSRRQRRQKTQQNRERSQFSRRNPRHHRHFKNTLPKY